MTSIAADTAYENAADAFTTKNPRSKAIYDRATYSLPGGNTRTSIFYHPFPLSIKAAEYARLYDVDGHEYVDLLGEFTAGLYGHSEPAVINAISEAAKRGLNFGSHHEDEVELAALVKGRFPSMDLLRFTNSGTEATLMAVAGAKAYTGKNKIVVFEGGYHGAVFTFKDRTTNPINVPHDFIFARYNDLSSVQRLLHDPENSGDIAALIVEPMVGSGGAIPADRIFLEGLRRVAKEVGAVLIFDEVMTSRMHTGGGIQSQLPSELRPDMTTLGKYIGGGMSFGAFGGKRAIMELFDPRKAESLSHAGTFNNNVLTMAAGRTGLEKVFTAARAQQLHATGDRLRTSLQVATAGTLMKVTGYGSIMCFHFTATELDHIKSPRDLSDNDKTLCGIFHLYMLEQGYYISRRGFVTLNLALTDDDLDGFVETVKAFAQSHRQMLSLEKPRSRL